MCSSKIPSCHRPVGRVQGLSLSFLNITVQCKPTGSSARVSDHGWQVLWCHCYFQVIDCIGEGNFSLERSETAWGKNDLEQFFVTDCQNRVPLWTHLWDQRLQRRLWTWESKNGRIPDHSVGHRLLKPEEFNLQTTTQIMICCSYILVNSFKFYLSFLNLYIRYSRALMLSISLLYFLINCNLF